MMTRALLLLLQLSLTLLSVHSATFDWILQTAQANWPARQMGGVECWPNRLTFRDVQGVIRTVGAGQVPNSGCPLVLWGGDDRRVSLLFSDVWVSVDAGRTWSNQGENDNLYQGSGNAGYTISNRGLMVKVGGSYTTSVVTSLSTSDPSTFDSANFFSTGPRGRSFPQVQFNARGDLYMVGGYFTPNDIRGDVWRSPRDECCGFWEPMGNLPAPRGAGALLFLSGASNVNNNEQDRLVYFGGSSSTGTSNDVYLTVDSGVTWANMVQAPWQPRRNHNAELTKDGLIVMAGGVNERSDGALRDLNDVWLSPDGGWSWTQCSSPPTNRGRHWSDREWLMTVIDQAGYIYVMGGNDYDGQETLADVWRSATSLHDFTALQDQCSLPSVRSGCPGYGLQCIPPSLPGGSSTVATLANSSFTVSCDACPLSSSSASTAYIAAVAAAVIFSLAFAAAVVYLYVLYTRAQQSGQTALFGVAARSGSSSTDAPSKTASGTSSEASTNGETGEESKEAYHKL